MKSIVAALLFSASPAFAVDYDNTPSEPTPPTCVAYFAVGGSETSSSQSKYVKEVLNKKGYIANYDAPCDPGPGYCVGASAYLEIRGFTTKAADGSFGVRLAAYHLQFQ